MPTHPLLQELDHLPEGLLATESRGLEALLGAPTLMHLRGARGPALFVSVLMHGNETVGWDAVRLLLSERIARFGEPRLPRDLCLFIGNVSAAAHGVRRLPGQPDYNRVWPGGELAPTPEHGLMQAVVENLRQQGLFASIDLHNNTGANPHYACVNRLDNRFLHLATLFGRTVVYFLRPRGVQSLALAELCPAVTLECGRVGDAAGVRHARDLVDAALHLAQIPHHPVAPQDIDLFHTVARVQIPERLSFSFSPAEADLVLNPEIEHYNFRELPAGTAFGRLDRAAAATGMPLEVRDEEGQEVGERFFSVTDGEVRLRQSVMPSMLTRDETVIRQDCLGYLMERYNDHVPHRG
jgi:Succinylglutamate desuccinylase / Aspartoacylase family